MISMSEISRDRKVFVGWGEVGVGWGWGGVKAGTDGRSYFK